MLHRSLYKSVETNREDMLRSRQFEMSNISADMVWQHFDRVEVDGRSNAVCKHCHHQLISNRGVMCAHYRMKHCNLPASMLGQIDPPTSKQLSNTSMNEPSSDMLVKSNNPPTTVLNQIDPSTSKSPSDTSMNKTPSDMSTSNSVSGKLQGRDEDAHKSIQLLAENRARDAIRYLALCATTSTAFRKAIDALPKPSIKRIYDMVCSDANGDAQVKLSPKQRRLCRKYRADVHASSKTKRRLLRSANRQAIRAVFGPLMLHTAFVPGDSGVMPTAL
jgi:hypothetical protein